MFNNIYNNRKVLVTGHTGFKGSWLALWLQSLGAEVFGFSLIPDKDPNHYDLLDLDIDDKIADIRDYNALKNWVDYCNPEIIFHLAAQPLVLRSYKEPIYTLETNILGTANILEASKNSISIRTVLIITSDKCYKNNEQIWAYRENDPMGGYDPYSASKGCSEIITSCWQNSFFKLQDYGKTHQTLVASARAGNVIGGGDWAPDRLVPDMMRAIHKQNKVKIRNPQATRPWQHVLEPLSGYLLLGQKLMEGQKDFAEAWNFGPLDEENITVEGIVLKAKKIWPGMDYEIAQTPDQPHEAGILKLDCSKARVKLKWKPVWTCDKAIEKTISWYRNYYESGNIPSHDHLDDYFSDAITKHVIWAEY